MASPHVTPELDGFDRFTVRLYRLGLALAAVGLAWTSVALWVGRSPNLTWLVVWVGTVLAAGNVHLYDKRVRWTVAWLAWGSLLVRTVAEAFGWLTVPEAAALGNGLMLAALSALVLKEWFCFRIPGVQFTPIALALAVFARYGGADRAAAVFAGLGAVGTLVVTVRKLRMPLGHDIGDRAAYQN